MYFELKRSSSEHMVSMKDTASNIPYSLFFFLSITSLSLCLFIRAIFSPIHLNVSMPHYVHVFHTPLAIPGHLGIQMMDTSLAHLHKKIQSVATSRAIITILEVFRWL